MRTTANRYDGIIFIDPSDARDLSAEDEALLIALDAPPRYFKTLRRRVLGLHVAAPTLFSHAGAARSALLLGHCLGRRTRRRKRECGLADTDCAVGHLCAETASERNQCD